MSLQILGSNANNFLNPWIREEKKASQEGIGDSLFKEIVLSIHAGSKLNFPLVKEIGERTSISSLAHKVLSKDKRSLSLPLSKEEIPQRLLEAGLQTIEDEKGNLIRVYSHDKSIDYQLFYEGNLVTITNHVTGEVHIQEINENGFVIREIFPNGLEVQFGYLDDVITQVTLPDKTAIEYEFEDGIPVAVKRLDAKGEVLYSHLYTSRTSNAIEEKLIGDVGVLKREYNEVTGQLAIIGPQMEQVITFDANQNVVSKKINGKLLTYSYDEKDQLIEKDEAIPSLNELGQLSSYKRNVCLYDNDGRLRLKFTKDDCFRFIYDAMDRLVQVSSSSQRIEYTYDILGRRLSKKVYSKGELGEKNAAGYEEEHYLYIGNNEIGVYDSKNNPKHLRVLGQSVHTDVGLAIAVESFGKTYAPIYDFGCNMIQLINIETKEIYRYDTIAPFGDNLASLNLINPWIFATKHYDPETNLVYFGNRYYDPSIKRWISPDPLENEVSENTYVFVQNNPLNRIDTDGRLFFVFPIIPFSISLIMEALAVLGIGTVAGIAVGKANEALHKAAEENRRAKEMNKKYHPLSQGRGKSQAAAAREEIERQLGRSLTQDEKRKFHDLVTGQGYNYHEMVEEGFEKFNDKYKKDSR